MSRIVFAAIVPHGDYIPALGGPNPRLMRKTHAAATKISKLLEDSDPDTIVIATPHGIIVDGYICIGATETASGTLRGRRASIVTSVAVDLDFANSLYALGDSAGLPLAKYVANAGGEPALPLDWGVIIPLYYTDLDQDGKKKYKYVIVAPSNSVHPSALVRFGECIAQAAAQTGRRVAYIASCDWAHAHSADGPYGFHTDAKRFDSEVQKIVRANRLDKLAQLDSKLVDNALADGIPQALILHGAIAGSGMKASLHSYERPTYFGMLVASFRR